MKSNLEGNDQNSGLVGDKSLALLLLLLLILSLGDEAGVDGADTGGWERPTFSLKSLSNVTHFIVFFPLEFPNIYEQISQLNAIDDKNISNNTALSSESQDFNFAKHQQSDPKSQPF